MSKIFDSTGILDEGLDSCNIADAFFEAVTSDSEPMDFTRVIDIYNDADTAGREAINNVFICLCGYQLTTLTEGVRG